MGMGMGGFRDASGQVWKFWKGRWRKSKPMADRAALREAWSAVVAEMHCHKCNGDQIQLVDFTEGAAVLRCRREVCRHRWAVTGRVTPRPATPYSDPPGWP